MVLHKIIFAILSLHLVYANPFAKLNRRQLREVTVHEDAGLGPLELIAKYGYPLERHWITTEDGYILNMHRIPHGLNNAGEENKPAVLLMHGLMSSGADFVNMGVNSPAFVLADRGYDVWLGNARGTTFSRNHTSLNPDDRDFWEFSWHEIGYYDLAAKTDYIIEQTGQEKIFLICHSQGTSASYVLTSQRPEYNDKLRLLISLAPIAYMSNLINPIFQVGALLYEEMALLFETLEWFELLRHQDNATFIEFCADGAPYQEMCGSLLFIMGGYNRPQLDLSRIPVFISNAPAGASYRQLLHYAQEIRSGHFRQYDHGTERNLEIYGQEFPPDYDLSQITAPTALFYSENDWCAATVDVEKMHSELGNPVIFHKMSDPRFNHIDFIWATDIIPLLYDKVIDAMSLY